MANDNPQALTVADQRKIAFNSLGNELEARKEEFGKLFQDPETADRFVRIAKNAIVKDPTLLECDRGSLIQACMAGATLGLMPDGKQGALVVYNTKVSGKNGEKDRWIKKVQFLSMVQGVIEVLYRSGRVRRVNTDVIYAGEQYDHESGENPYLTHKPSLEIRNTDNPEIIAAYCIVETKDGVKHIRLLPKKKINKARSVARSDNVWSKFEDEMSIKTAVHSLAKMLPKEREHGFAAVHEMIQQESDFYDMDKAKSLAPPQRTALTHNPHDMVEESDADQEDSGPVNIESNQKSEARSLNVIEWAIEKSNEAQSWSDIERLVNLVTKKPDFQELESRDEHLPLYKHISELPLWKDANSGSIVYSRIVRDLA